MVSRRYSGYLADDESLRRPQMRNSSPRRATIDWRDVLRPPSRGLDGNTTSSISAVSVPTQDSECRSTRDSSTSRERRHVTNEFAEFVDFLADEEVLDSLQDIVEDAVRKLCKVTNEKGEHVFDLQEESSSSPDSTTWSFSCSQRQGDSSSKYSSRSKYTTTTFTTTTTGTSSSEDEWQSQRRPLSGRRVCLLDKYAARIPKEEKSEDRVSGGFHAEIISERSGDDYYFCEEHFQAWARLAESFHFLQGPKRDYFAKFKKAPPTESLSAESLHKEITNVLKRPTPSSLLLYHPGQQPFEALDFLEENKILAALQDIINQAVQKVLEATSLTEGLPLFNIFDEHGHLVHWESSEEEEGSEEGELEREEEYEGEEGEEEEEGDEESGSGVTGSGAETSEGESDDGMSADGKKKKKKKKKKKGKQKKKKMAMEAHEAHEDEKGKQRYSPPPLPKSKRKAGAPEEPQRKAKYVAPPLPKTKPRATPEEPTPKAKYVPPPLPKPRQKKPQELAPGVPETPSKQKILAKHIITSKDIKRARLDARPPPKQAIIDFLIENAAKLILYKYNYETLLSEKLGMISVPVTKVLLEIMFGYKRIKGSGIRLSSQIDWEKVYEEIYAPRPRRPRTPKHKGDDKKKDGRKKKMGDMKKIGDRMEGHRMEGHKMEGHKMEGHKMEGHKMEGHKTDGHKMAGHGEKQISMKSMPRLPMPGGKVLVTKSRVKSEVVISKSGRKEIIREQIASDGPEIYEIVPPKSPEDFPEEEEDYEEGESETPKEPITPTDESVKSSSKVTSGPAGSEEALPSISSKQSVRRSHVAPRSRKGSKSALPEVEPGGQSSGELMKKSSSSRKSSFTGEASKKSSTVLPKI